MNSPSILSMFSHAGGRTLVLARSFRTWAWSLGPLRLGVAAGMVVLSVVPLSGCELRQGRSARPTYVGMSTASVAPSTMTARAETPPSTPPASMPTDLAWSGPSSYPPTPAPVFKPNVPLPPPELPEVAETNRQSLEDELQQLASASSKNNVPTEPDADLERSVEPRGPRVELPDGANGDDELRPSPDRSPPERPTAPRRPQVATDYTIGIGDELEIIFSESWNEQKVYRLVAGDEIQVEMLAGLKSSGSPQSTLDRTVRLQPDGKISLPFLGVVPAAGYSVEDLAAVLTKQYEAFYVEPDILVTLQTSGEGLKSLRESLRSSGGRTTMVSPDGTITVPNLGPVPALGLRPAEIEDEINERYRRTMPGVRVTVRLAGGR